MNKNVFSIRSIVTICITALSAMPAAAKESTPKPKYGVTATRLFRSHEYIRTHAAPDFWALLPYYAPQQSGKSCSAASVSMLINAVRADRELSAEDELVNEERLLKTTDSSDWKRDLGPTGQGVTLDELAKFTAQALKAYGYDNATAEAFHASKTTEAKAKLHQALVENEKSDRDFILVNYLQSVYTGDPEGVVGHIAPVAAYDQKNARVLIFDPDRQYYEPYWVSEATLLEGMATADKTAGKNRGFLWVRVKKP